MGDTLLLPKDVNKIEAFVGVYQAVLSQRGVDGKKVVDLAAQLAKRCHGRGQDLPMHVGKYRDQA